MSKYLRNSDVTELVKEYLVMLYSILPAQEHITFEIRARLCTNVESKFYGSFIWSMFIHILLGRV